MDVDHLMIKDTKFQGRHNADYRYEGPFTRWTRSSKKREAAAPKRARRDARQSDHRCPASQYQISVIPMPMGGSRSRRRTPLHDNNHISPPFIELPTSYNRWDKKKTALIVIYFVSTRSLRFEKQPCQQSRACAIQLFKNISVFEVYLPKVKILRLSQSFSLPKSKSFA